MYFFDTSSFRVISNYFPGSFPTFWDRFDDHVKNGRVLSVREVRKELDNWAADHLEAWVKANRAVFHSPSEAEMLFVSQIFAVPGFQNMVRRQQMLQGLPVADPFLVAAAAQVGGCVVTEERARPNSAKLPNVCAHFKVQCTNVQGFMDQEGWSF